MIFFLLSGHPCGLHFHLGHKIKGIPGKWEFRAHKEIDRRFGPMISSKAAVGVLMGVGNVGDRLKDQDSELSTYVSRDAGESWVKVAEGSMVYDIADQGTLIVAGSNIKATKDVRTCSVCFYPSFSLSHSLADLFSQLSSLSPSPSASLSCSLFLNSSFSLSLSLAVYFLAPTRFRISERCQGKARCWFLSSSLPASLSPSPPLLGFSFRN